MYKEKKALFLMVQTPLHVGSGSDLGIVDLPIQRERHTGFPKIEASSLKGAIRENFESIDTFDLEGKTVEINRQANNQDLYLVFGPDGSDDAHAGAIGFSDARILLFPVKSMKEVFAWITCPKVLQQFKYDMEIIGKNVQLPDFSELSENKCLTHSNNLTFKGKVVLEEYTFEANSISNSNEFTIEQKFFGEWLAENVAPETQWTSKLKTDIVILRDDDFKDFVELSTEVITRTKINNETGTVETGALFTEEYLPAETLMYSLTFTSDFFLNKKLLDDKYSSSKLIEIAKEQKLFIYNDKKIIENKTSRLIMQFLENAFKTLNNYMQIGGNATLGKGLTYIKLI